MQRRERKERYGWVRCEEESASEHRESDASRGEGDEKACAGHFGEALAALDVGLSEEIGRTDRGGQGAMARNSGSFLLDLDAGATLGGQTNQRKRQGTTRQVRASTPFPRLANCAERLPLAWFAPARLTRYAACGLDVVSTACQKLPPCSEQSINQPSKQSIHRGLLSK